MVDQKRCPFRESSILLTSGNNIRQNSIKIRERKQQQQQQRQC
uniref:Uncharacterized protein n=1 Tax=Octopus bimaculoides TaxID=37653 RepID=A0A0L8GPP8_OCTBM